MSMEEHSDSFDFELVSPERRLLSHKAMMVVIPGEEGDFAVLPDHTALLSSIRPGLLRVFRENKEESFDVFLSGGFADVTATSCSILAETAIRVSDMDKTQLEKDLTDLNEDLRLAETGLEGVRIKRQIALVQAKIETIKQVEEAA